MPDTPQADSSTYVCLGAIAGAHGVRGDLRVKTFTANPLDIGAYGPLTSEDGSRVFEITRVKPDKMGARITVKGVTGREQAAALKGIRLYVARDKLPALVEDDFYHADLIGLPAFLPDGTAIGTIRAVHDFGSGDLLEIDNEFIPFTRENVPEIKLSGPDGQGRVTVVRPVSIEPSPEELNEEINEELKPDSQLDSQPDSKKEKQ